MVIDITAAMVEKWKKNPELHLNWDVLIGQTKLYSS